MDDAQTDDEETDDEEMDDETIKRTRNRRRTKNEIQIHRALLAGSQFKKAFHELDNQQRINRANYFAYLFVGACLTTDKKHNRMGTDSTFKFLRSNLMLLKRSKKALIEMSMMKAEDMFDVDFKDVDN